MPLRIEMSNAGMNNETIKILYVYRESRKIVADGEVYNKNKMEKLTEERVLETARQIHKYPYCFS